jgi:hypothetical protein
VISILEAMDDPALFQRWFRGESWSSWRAIAAAAFGLEMSDADLAFFNEVAGGRAPPKKRVKELWISVGRRGGKDSFASLTATYTAALFDGADRLRPGERALCLCLACDTSQAKIVLNLIRAFFTEIPMLRLMIARETQWGFQLTNGVDVFVGVNDFRAVRGRTILCAILDECAFFRDDSSASPDRELYRAIKPGMVTLPESMLIGISSPYRRAGLLYSKFKTLYGIGADDALFIKAPSRTLNPTLSQEMIDRALEEDPAAASSEWLAEFRDDLASFISIELIESMVDRNVMARPAVPGARYHAFCDAASGTGKDSFALAVGHKSGESIIIDLVHEQRPPFNPQTAIAECCNVLRTYNIRTISGDRYAPGFTADAFQRHGVHYRYSEHDKSQLYVEALPALVSGRVRLPDNRRMVTQFANLERRTGPSGRDRVDHPRNDNAHDDLANAVAGVVVAVDANWSAPCIVTPLIA